MGVGETLCSGGGRAPWAVGNRHSELTRCGEDRRRVLRGGQTQVNDKGTKREGQDLQTEVPVWKMGEKQGGLNPEAEGKHRPGGRRTWHWIKRGDYDHRVIGEHSWDDLLSPCIPVNLKIKVHRPYETLHKPVPKNPLSWEGFSLNSTWLRTTGTTESMVEIDTSPLSRNTRVLWLHFLEVKDPTSCTGLGQYFYRPVIGRLSILFFKIHENFLLISTNLIKIFGT